MIIMDRKFENGKATAEQKAKRATSSDKVKIGSELARMLGHKNVSWNATDHKPFVRTETTPQSVD